VFWGKGIPAFAKATAGRQGIFFALGGRSKNLFKIFMSEELNTNVTPTSKPQPLMKTFSKCFNVILTGDRDASHQAARQIRRLVYGSAGDKFKDIASIIESAPKEYEKITEGFRQENFVIAVSVMYFLHDKESQPDFLFPWLFHLIQHPNGNIRQAAVRMFRQELGPLTVHIRFPNEKSAYRLRLSPEQADFILFKLSANLNDLTKNLWKPAYKRYKYISSLPNGPYKSIRMVLGQLEDDCGNLD